jgi:7-carboxy-7-deazaguanine synthase
MTYVVKEIFYTLQGEGTHTGRPAVFCRFAGCNLWSGREQDRLTAVCTFCDTDFVGTDGTLGGRYETAEDLANAIRACAPDEWDEPFVVCTGGEPALQLDTALISSLHAYKFRIAIETNGTRALPAGVDWICVSPKATAPLVQRRGNELKLVYPQSGIGPESFMALDFEQFLLQPLDGPDTERNTALAISYCLAHPQWRLSLQTHKFAGIR